MYHYGLGCRNSCARVSARAGLGFADPFEGMFTSPDNPVPTAEQNTYGLDTPWNMNGPDQAQGGTQEESVNQVEGPAPAPRPASGASLFSGWPLKMALAGITSAAIFTSGKKKTSTALIAGAVGYVLGHFVERQ